MYKKKAISLKDFHCGNCQSWLKCKGQKNCYGLDRQEDDIGCINFYPVVLDGKQIDEKR